MTHGLIIADEAIGIVEAVTCLGHRNLRSPHVAARCKPLFGSFLDANITYAARSRRRRQGKVRCVWTFAGPEVIGWFISCVSFEALGPKGMRPTATISVFKVHGMADGQGAMVVTIFRSMGAFIFSEGARNSNASSGRTSLGELLASP